MKFCYVDESGYGDEPVLVVAGVVVDSFRMHITKQDWEDLLNLLSHLVGRPVSEFKTRRFYKGRGIWHDLGGDERATVIDAIVAWLGERKHDIAFAAVDKQKLQALPKSDLPEGFPDECPSHWVLGAFHLLLGIQKHHQRLEKNKGHTVFVFDREVMEERGLVELVGCPPTWSDTFYSANSEARLDQIVDVPYFADSEDVGLLQVADLFAYLLRRYGELEAGYDQPSYPDEKAKLRDWAKQIVSIALPRSTRWPRRNICRCAAFFNAIAPTALVELG
ncbi:MAG: DUF3800 domain-containing protein [Dehalococcoidia bacterium]